MIIDFLKINEVISEKLQSNEPFSVIRLDNTIGYIFDCVLQGKTISPEILNEDTLLQGGIYPSNAGYYMSEIIPRVYKCMLKSDILGVVDISGNVLKGKFFEHVGSVPYKFAGPHNHYIFDPGGLFGYSSAYNEPLENPWTKYLKDKKVLAISTHAESIKEQWKNIDKIWGDKRELIAPFELVDCIRSPYHPSMDDRQLADCNTWVQSVSSIIKTIDTYDYDVILAGNSTSAPFYAQHAKSKGKVGIQTGGVLQLYFGILGYRWTKVPGHNGWSNLYNEYWKYPLKIDEANNREKYKNLETNFAYW